MIKFLDGPAADKVLMLRRAPVFLRVVIDPAGGIDALDQLADTPELHETIHAYEVVGAVSWCHIKASKPAASGFFKVANYKLCAEQPTDEEMRQTRKWRDWTTAQGEKRK